MASIYGYKILNLFDVIGTSAEGRIKNILSSYLCPQNPDVKDFLKNKAMEFARQRIASTYLVFSSHKEEPVLVGYFTLANKVFSIKDKVIPSNSMRKRISKFAEHNEDTKAYTFSTPLIAQLGKNYANGYNKLISGDELLALACKQVDEIQVLLSGKFTYVECEDNEKLINFYYLNGFRRIADRKLNKLETIDGGPPYLVQMIKFIGN